ncbi:membrane dipeptidase [Palleronia aestuarii]|uniref:Membrane dipeptidase n=1 Tax=Palleronia aestuarii TaxID=568105 RepID=A0A2W7NCH5_9RHOB|nr:dipeptidase [Palleronia aestuarii]PZX17680.1 membrane dipeptidase [Palleronia aestuarii]
MTVTTPLVFDGHNDLLYALGREGRGTVGRVLTGRRGAIDLPKARAGGFAGGFFAVYVPSPEGLADRFEEMEKPAYDLPLPEAIDWHDAWPVALSQMAILFDLERRGALRVCRSVAEIREAMAQGQMAAVLHMEGAEAIDPDLDTLEILYQAGLRSLGPVWSRPTIFGHGVPFRYPSDGDTGEGLTDLGVRLVRRCDALGILVDLSHMNMAGFRDVARHSSKPLIASHSNAHALSPHARNLTDGQLEAIRDSDGLVGLNFAVAFLRSDGRMLPNVPVETLLRHLDHLIGIVGEDRVGLGSDFDGATVPDCLKDIGALPVLRRAMADHGFGAELIEKICHRNWLAVLERSWGG